jgi:hypothetical protein
MVIPSNFSGNSEENHGKYESGYPIFGLSLEAGTF